MIKPRLYEAGTTDFSNNGIGVLVDAIDCRVKQGLGSSVLEMQYPLSGKMSEYIDTAQIIYAQPEPDAAPQPYSIFRMRKMSKGTVYVYARHICYNLDGKVVLPFSATSLNDALGAIGDSTFPGGLTPFSLSTDRNVLGNFSVSQPMDAWSIIGVMDGSLLERYGGEAVFDHFSLKIVEKRGADRGFTIKYGQNLLTLEQEENIAKCYSGVMAYYNNAAAPANRTLVEAPNAKVSDRFLPVDFTATINDAGGTGVLSLEQAAREYIEKNKIGIPEINLDVQLATLRGSTAYSDVQPLEKICIGDTVQVLFPKMGVTASARIVETNYDCLRDRYDRVVVGNAKQNVADIIARQSKDIKKLKG